MKSRTVIIAHNASLSATVIHGHQLHQSSFLDSFAQFTYFSTDRSANCSVFKMRTSFFISLSIAALVVAQTPLVANYEALRDLGVGLSDTLANWPGTFRGLLPIIAPAVLQGAQLLRVIVNINKLTRSTQPLSEEDADAILKIIGEINENRPFITDTVVLKKDSIVSLSPGLGDFVLASCDTLGNLATESHEALLNAMPGDKKDKLAMYWDKTLLTISAISGTYEQVQGTYEEEN